MKCSLPPAPNLSERRARSPPRAERSRRFDVVVGLQRRQSDWGASVGRSPRASRGARGSPGTPLPALPIESTGPGGPRRAVPRWMLSDLGDTASASLSSQRRCYLQSSDCSV